MARSAKPSASDLAEIASGKGSARDKAEAAMGDSKGSSRRAIKGRRGGSTKRRSVQPKR